MILDLSILITISVIIFILGFIVYLKNHRRLPNRLFFVFIILVILWSFTSFLEEIVSNRLLISILWRIDYGVAPLISLFFLFFSQNYPRENINAFRRNFLVFSPIVVALSIISIATKLVIIDINYLDTGIKFVTGRLFIIYGSVIIFLFGWGFLILFKKKKESHGIERFQIMYVLLGLFISASVAILTNLIIPQFIETPTNISKFGVYGIVFFITGTFYAITRYRLMDIKLVIKRSLVYLLVIIAVAVAYLSVAYLIIEPLTQYLNISRKIFFATWGLVIVFAFQPIKKYIDQATDRVFFKGTRDYNAILSELSQNMSLVVDLGKVVEIACKSIEEKLHIKETFFLIHISNHLEHYVVSRLAKDLHKKRLHSKKGLGEYVEVDSPLIKYFSRNYEIIVRDELKQRIANEEFIGQSKELQGVLSELIRLNAQVAVPLKARGGLVGVFLSGNKKSDEVYTKSEIDFFNILASHLATAIERSRLYDRLEVKINELITLQELSKIINSSLDISHTLNAVMDAVIKVAGVDRALLYLLDKSGKELVATVGRGDKEEVYRGVVVDLSKSSLAYVVKNKKPLIVEDVKQDERVNLEYARAVKTKGFIAVPLMTKEKVLGVIGVDNLHTGRPLSSVNIELLMTFASQAAIAIDNTRLYQEVKDFNISLKKKVDEATKHLKELIKIKSDFLTVASHQLRTPTSIVRGMLSLVQEEEGLSQEEKDRFISQAYQGINRLERIIHDLLNATELEGKKMKLYLKPVSVDTIINEIILELSLLAKNKGVALKFQKSKTPPPKVMADGLKLREALQNVIDNAIQYTPQGTITIELEHTPRQVRVIVQDNGIGMSKTDLRWLFGKFSRGQGVLQIHPNGSGLGLFITKKIIEGMEGAIKAESEGKNKGSKFTITLPVPKKSQLLK